jgi:hypothetical protein
VGEGGGDLELDQPVIRAGAAALAVLLSGWGAAQDGSSAAGVPAPADRAAPPGRAEAPRGPFHFTDVTREAGLAGVSVLSGRPGKDHLLDSAGTGAAFLDFDRDGRLDIYLVNGWRLEGAAVADRGRNALYRGRPDGTFEDVTGKAGVSGEGRWGSGVAAADQDGDGWTDLLVTNFGPNLLYRNRRDGTFEDVAARVGIAAPGWNTGAAFFDADADGDLDVYIAAYIDCTLDDVLRAQRTLDWKSLEKVAAGPFGMKGAADHFFRAEPGGRFVDVTVAAGFEDRALAFGFAVRAADFDGDGDQDVFVANDSDANYYFRNEGGGRFQELGLLAGCALNAAGSAQASMGVAAGDVNGDGHLDLFITTFAEDTSTLHRGLGNGLFEDVSAAWGLVQPTYVPLSWGAALADFDLDGDLDLAVANGHIYPQVDRHPQVNQTYAQRNTIFENRGQSFADVTAAAGPGFEMVRSSRGLAAGDYDQDGDVDLLYTSLDTPPALLRNDGRPGSWLTVVLEDAAGPLSVVGARVTVTAGGKTQRRDVAAGDSYMSTHDPRPHFGLGGAERVERVEVRWPDGGVTEVRDVSARQFLKVRRKR